MNNLYIFFFFITVSGQATSGGSRRQSLSERRSSLRPSRRSGVTHTASRRDSQSGASGQSGASRRSVHFQLNTSGLLGNDLENITSGQHDHNTTPYNKNSIGMATIYFILFI